MKSRDKTAKNGKEKMDQETDVGGSESSREKFP